MAKKALPSFLMKKPDGEIEIHAKGMKPAKPKGMPDFADRAKRIGGMKKGGSVAAMKGKK